MKEAFEGDTILAAEVERLLREYQIQSVIETGTETGVTANWFAQRVSEVVTIDVTRSWTSLSPNIRFMQGDSQRVLPFAIARSTPPILFFLDAHSSNPEDICPLREELLMMALSVNRYPPPVIVIHDARVPDHPELGYDTYQEGDIGLEMASGMLVGIYPRGYDYSFNSEATGARRGVLFITPAPVLSSSCNAAQLTCSTAG